MSLGFISDQGKWQGPDDTSNAVCSHLVQDHGLIDAPISADEIGQDVSETVLNDSEEEEY